MSVIESIKFTCQDETIEVSTELLKDSELIQTIQGLKPTSESGILVIPSTSKDLLNFLDRQNKKLSILPEHYLIADFLIYDYEPSLWTPTELKILFKNIKNDTLGTDMSVDKVCKYIKKHSTFDPDQYLRCKITDLDIIGLLSKIVIRKGVKERLRKNTGKQVITISSKRNWNGPITQYNLTINFKK